MPVFTYQAMDNTGQEVEDTIEASSEEEAQTLIKEQGFYVTRIDEKVERKKKSKSKADAKPRRKGGGGFSIGGDVSFSPLQSVRRRTQRG